MLSPSDGKMTDILNSDHDAMLAKRTRTQFSRTGNILLHLPIPSPLTPKPKPKKPPKKKSVLIIPIHIIPKQHLLLP